MICTCNGVIAALSEYGDSRMTDAYVLPDRTLVLRTHPMPLDNDTNGGKAHVLVKHIHHWFDEHGVYGVMIVLPMDWDDHGQLELAGNPAP